MYVNEHNNAEYELADVGDMGDMAGRRFHPSLSVELSISSVVTVLEEFSRGNYCEGRY